MKKNNLLVTKENKLKARRARTSYKSKPKPIRPNQIWGIDMTKILIQNTGWVYLQVVLDWYTKKITGYSLSFTSKTGLKFMQARKDSGIKQIFTSPLEANQPQADYNNPKGNADTVCQRQIRLRRKRVIRTLKEDLIWIRESHSVEESRQNLKV